MCRFAAYVGPPRPLSTLLYDPPRSLEVLAYAPEEMLSGRVNVDGTGVAWWDDDDPRPLRYRTVATPWADPNLPELAPRLRGRVQLAAVRSATPGIPFGPANVAPFVDGTLAFAHNGWLGGYREGVGRTLLSRLPDDVHAGIDTVSDSVAFFATFLAHVRGGAGGDLGGALVAAAREVAEVCREAGRPATLNALASDGVEVVALRTSEAHACNSLYLTRDGDRWPGATVVASEPLDPDLDWEAVPEHALVRIRPDRADVETLAP